MIEGGAGACVPASQSCAPDEFWDGQRCGKVASCPTGSQWDPARGNCVTYAQQGDDVAIVNVQAWAETSYGPNGGNGTSSFCNRFVGKPWRFGVSEGQSATLQITVQIAAPDGAIAQANAVTSQSYVGNPIAVPAQGAQAIQAAALEILAALRGGGGKASAPSAQTVVKCMVRNAAAPVVVPTQGGV